MVGSRRVRNGVKAVVRRTSMFPFQSRMARAALGWSLFDAADAAGLSAKTILRFEKEHASTPKRVEQIKAAYESAGISFTLARRKAGVSVDIAVDRISVQYRPADRMRSLG